MTPFRKQLEEFLEDQVPKFTPGLTAKERKDLSTWFFVFWIQGGPASESLMKSFRMIPGLKERYTA